jgi:probable phosphoglycerate mutase
MGTSARPSAVFLVRHGETEWSLSGQHTGVTDLPLTENGRRAAQQLAPLLAETEFALVLTSPLARARTTCELAGLGDRMQVDPDLSEWSYGAYEGLTAEQIHRSAPGWLIFTDGCPGGESPDQVGARVDRVIRRIREAAGRVALFAHGHFLRVFAARWIGLPPAHGRHFLLDTSTLSILGYYRGIPALKCGNALRGDALLLAEGSKQMTDIPEITDEQLERAIPARLRRRLVQGRFDSGEDIAALRTFVGLTQAEFARAIGTSVHTLRNWEQGRRKPEGPAIALLRIAARHPRILRENLESAA